jgi:hypothetical protein
MTSRTDMMSAGNSRAAYMREYRRRRRLEEDNCNNVPKRTELRAERQCEYIETHKNISAEYMRNCNLMTHSTLILGAKVAQ